MRRKPSASASEDAHELRFAGGVAFFVTVILIAVLGLAHSAQALTVPTAGSPAAAAFVPPFDEEEDEAEVSEDEFEGEGEYCEEDREECESAREEVAAPAECLLSTASATVSAANDRVRLQIRYTASTPTAVSVEYGLHGSRGALYLGVDRKRFGARGTLRLSEHLTEAQMAKVTAAKSFTVRLRVPAAPAYCGDLFSRQLDVKRATPSGLSWSQAA